MDNLTIAHKLSEYAAELDQTRSDLYRVRAYRHAADVVCLWMSRWWGSI